MEGAGERRLSGKLQENVGDPNGGLLHGSTGGNLGSRPRKIIPTRTGAKNVSWRGWKACENG